jgi:hypothetical protein
LEGLEGLEDFEGAEVEAVGGIDAALNAVKGIEGAVVGLAERGIVLDGFVNVLAVGEGLVQAFDAVVPEVGFDAAEAALGPLGGDEGIDERELGSASGMVLAVECRGEGFECGGVFVADDFGMGVDAGFQGVERGGGFAFGGGGAGGFLGIEAIGVELGLG